MAAKIFTSSIAKKLGMALTGMVLYGFLVGHLAHSGQGLAHTTGDHDSPRGQLVQESGGDLDPLQARGLVDPLDDLAVAQDHGLDRAGTQVDAGERGIPVHHRS